MKSINKLRLSFHRGNGKGKKHVDAVGLIHDVTASLVALCAFVTLQLFSARIPLVSCNGITDLYTDVHSAGQCHSETGLPRLDLEKCLTDDLILILGSFQGRHKKHMRSPISRVHRQAQCRYNRDDCVESATTDMESRLAAQCVGQPSCSVTVDGGWMRSCNSYGQYTHVIYQCVPRSRVADICSASTRMSERLVYVSSPAYPTDYRPNIECVCTAVTDPDQRVLVRLVGESVIEESDNCRRDAVLIYDGLDLVGSRCGRLPAQFNLTSRSNAVLIGFRTDGSGQHRGFWMAIEALGKISLTCGPASLLLTADNSIAMETESILGDLLTSEVNTTSVSAVDTSVSRVLEDADIPLPTETMQDEIQPSFDYELATTDERSTLLAIIGSIVFVSIVIMTAVFFASWIRRRRNKAHISVFHLNSHDVPGSDVMKAMNMPRFGMACHTPSSFGPHDQLSERGMSPLSAAVATAAAAAATSATATINPSLDSSSPLSNPAMPSIAEVERACRMRQATPPRSQRRRHNSHRRRARRNQLTNGGPPTVGAVKPSIRSPRIDQSVAGPQQQHHHRHHHRHLSTMALQQSAMLEQVLETAAVARGTSPDDPDAWRSSLSPPSPLVVDVRRYVHNQLHQHPVHRGLQVTAAVMTSPTPMAFATRTITSPTLGNQESP